jgi:PIN domain nuclease of toxin-antitoxin system
MLSPTALVALQDPASELWLSAATIWEIAIKVGQRKLTLALPFRTWMETAIQDLQLRLLPITVLFAEQQSLLPPHHKDPFDRLLVAQAIVERIPIVSADQALDAYGITRIW